MQLTDASGRKINYLRLSVTDRCNMRCRYCMPVTGVEKLPQNKILSYEQLFFAASCAVAEGIQKIRVTGGEPLVRKGILDFLSHLSTLPGLKQLALTTNGVLLAEMGPALKRAGVQRINISLDSLHPEVFTKITRRNELSRVLAGIATAERLDIPVKINMVVMRGINDSELVAFADLTRHKNYSVRFIEYMPANKEKGWQKLVVPGSEILERISASHDYMPIEKISLSGPAREYRITGAKGTIGLITALSGHFCDDCNRLRITASGKVKGCLFSDVDTDISALLRAGEPTPVRMALRALVGRKSVRHELTETVAGHKIFAMAGIGG